MKHFEDFYREAQQYSSILKCYEDNGDIFTDPNFHPSPNCNIKETNVSFEEKTTIWERIDKYYTAPLFKKEAIHEDAIQQGQLGNCYFIASLFRIARQPEIVELLFDTRTRKTKNNNDNEFIDTINLKCGAVIVYIYVFGRRTPILIDTLIPFERGTRKPLFSHPTDIKYSPWFCLVEKAYAKVNGCYSFIIGGSLSKAIYNLFGYYPCYKVINQIIEKKESSISKQEETNDDNNSNGTFDENEYLFSLLMQWQYENAVIGADILLDKLRKNVTETEIIDNGLVTDHTYLIIKVRREEGKNFICLKNPWGDHEWLGDWSDTSSLWTPSLKKSLGVHLKDNGTFWMIDRDFFHFFSSIYIAKPVNPEYHCKSVVTYLLPGDNDGHTVEEREAHLENRQTFAFKLKNVRVKTADQENENSNENENIKTVDDAKVYIRIEKRSPFCYTADDNKDKVPNYSLFVVFNNGQKINFDQIGQYNRQTVTTKTQFFRETVHIVENDPFVIVLQRIDKADYAEECYIQFSCKYDFDLYDVDHPEKLAEEDEKVGVIFDNQSKRYQNISKKICLKTIDGKELNGFDDSEPNKFNFNNLILNKDSEDSSQFFAYDTDESLSSNHDQKSKNKVKNSEKNNELYNSSSSYSSFVQDKEKEKSKEENIKSLVSSKKGSFLNLENYQKKAKLSDTIFSNLYEIIERKTNTSFSAKASKFEINDLTQSETDNLTKEIKELDALNHPSILKFIGYSPFNFRNKPKPVIVTELAPNQSLDDILESERNGKKVSGWDDTKKLINIFGIASGMSYLHSRNILHRDLKPCNILIDKNLFPKISDFGFLTNNQNQMTMNFQPRYSAPEILNSEECTKESEVYTFSLIVYEIMTNQKAYHDLNNLKQIFREVVINEERPEFKLPIPECYQNLIESCWKQDPKERPTFNKIVNILKKDPRFITPNVNKQDYLQFVEYIKSNIDDSYLDEDNHDEIKPSSNSDKDKNALIEKITEPKSDDKVDISKNPVKNSNSDKKPEETSNSDKKPEETSNSDKKSDQNSNSDKKLDENSNSDKKSDQNSNSDKKVDQNSNSGKKPDENSNSEASSSSEHKNNSFSRSNSSKKSNSDQEKKASIPKEVKNRSSQFPKISLFDTKLNTHSEMPANQIFEIEVISQFFVTSLYSTENDKTFNDFINDFDKDKFASFHFNNNKKTNDEFVSICTLDKLLLLPTKNNDEINPQVTAVFDLIKGCKIYPITSHDEAKLAPYTSIDLSQSFPEKAEMKQVQNLVHYFSPDILPNNIKYENPPMKFTTFGKHTWSTIAVYMSVSKPFEFNMVAAEKGNSAALFNIGLMFSNGDGVQQDKKKAAKYYQKAADLGLAKAQFNLGCMYTKGVKDAVNQDKQKAAELFEKAANQGHLKSQLNLGNIYSTGDGVPQNYKKAVKYYEKAAEQNDPEAQTNLGIIYQKGVDKIIHKNLARAAELYQKAADQGVLLAQFNLGVLYSKGDKDFPQNKEKAFELFQKAADQGDADAKLNLAAMYAKGESPNGPDINKALQLYEEAAEQGNMKAQFNLAVMYAKGNGVQKDIQKAIQYYEAASDQGMHQAMLNLGVIYFKGAEGVAVDKQKAADLFEKASDKNLRAIFNLAVMLQKGDGIEKDEKKSIELYEKAAALNSAEALLNLGIIYDEGNQYVPQDKKKAVELYKRAAELGNAKAMLNLGIMYQDGQGCKANKSKAKEYFKNAARLGNVQAQTNLALLRLLDDDPNDEKAMKYLKSASELGNISAMLSLAKKYRNDGDMNNAIKYYSKAASQGNPKGQFELGKIFMNGNGTEENLDKAEQLLKEAAEHKVNEAYLALGDLYTKKGDNKNARKNYKLALESGIKEAEDKLNSYDYSNSDNENEKSEENENLIKNEVDEKTEENKSSVEKELIENSVKNENSDGQRKENDNPLNKELNENQNENDNTINEDTNTISKETPILNEEEEKENVDSIKNEQENSQNENQVANDNLIEKSEENEKAIRQINENNNTDQNKNEDPSKNEMIENKNEDSSKNEIIENKNEDSAKDEMIENKNEDPSKNEIVENKNEDPSKNEIVENKNEDSEKSNKNEIEIEIEEEEEICSDQIEFEEEEEEEDYQSEQHIQSESQKENHNKSENEEEDFQLVKLVVSESEKPSILEKSIGKESEKEKKTSIEKQNKNEEEECQIEKLTITESEEEAHSENHNESENEKPSILEKSVGNESEKEKNTPIEKQNKNEEEECQIEKLTITESEEEVHSEKHNASEIENPSILGKSVVDDKDKKKEIAIENQSQSENEEEEYRLEKPTLTESEKEIPSEKPIPKKKERKKKIEPQEEKHSQSESEEEFQIKMQSETANSEINQSSNEKKVEFKRAKDGNSKLVVGKQKCQEKGKQNDEDEYDSDSSEINQLCTTCDEYSQIDETTHFENLFASLEERIRRIHGRIVGPYKDFKSALTDISNLFLNSSLSDCVASYTHANSSLDKVEKEITGILSKRIKTKKATLKPISSGSSSSVSVMDDELASLQSEVKSLESKLKQLDEQLRATRSRPLNNPRSTSSHSMSAKSLLEYSSSDLVSSSAVETVLTFSKIAEPSEEPDPSKITESSHRTKIQPPKENGSDSRLSRSPRISHSPHPRRTMISRLKKRADDGDEEAQFTLGACYEVGEGVRKNSGSALKYYMQSADQSNPNAQFAAAVCYTSGKGTEVDKEKAFDLFTKAAEQGHDKAQFAVGHFYEFEKEKNEQNLQKASKWYQKAADQGHPAAIHAIKSEADTEICVLQLT